jgi:hypothetical protein
MTEHSSFGTTAVAEPPAPLLPAGYDEGGEDGNRRKLAIVGAIVGVVVLLVAALFLLKGGSSSPSSSAPVPSGKAAGAKATGTTGTGAAHQPIKLPKSFTGNLGRDPFKVLYVAPVAAAAGKGTGTSSTGTTGTTGKPSPGTSGSTGSTGSTGSKGGSGSGSGPQASFAPVWIELVGVKGTKSATFVVGYSNGKRSTTKPFGGVLAPTQSLRTQFGGVFALLSIQDGTATVQFGDGTPFDLAPGFGNRHFVG